MDMFNYSSTRSGFWGVFIICVFTVLVFPHFVFFFILYVFLAGFFTLIV